MDGLLNSANPALQTPTERISKELAFETLETEITELWGHINAATFRFLELVAQFDRNKGWARHGLANCAQWLNWQCGIGPCAAREKVRVARALEHLPRISAAFRQGQISYSKARAITRVATPEMEGTLLNVALYGTASHLGRLVRQFRWVERMDLDRYANAQYRSRYVHYSYDQDDSMLIVARLPAEVGALVKQAIEAAMALDDGTDSRVSAETHQPETASQTGAEAFNDETASCVSAETPRVTTARRYAETSAQML